MFIRKYILYFQLRLETFRTIYPFDSKDRIELNFIFRITHSHQVRKYQFTLMTLIVRISVISAIWILILIYIYSMYFYLHATRMMRLSSMALPENHGFDARHISSALSFSDVTFKLSMLVVVFESCEEE